MNSRLPSDRVAGLLSLVAATLVGAIWYIYLFVAPVRPESLTASAIDTLKYTFSSENEMRWWFAWLAALCLCCAAVGAAYLLNVGRKRQGAILLFSVLIFLALGTLAFTAWPLALFVALPAYWGYRCVHGA
jgi:cytochrome bd-type quinol oxidase subunit 2